MDHIAWVPSSTGFVLKLQPEALRLHLSMLRSWIQNGRRDGYLSSLALDGSPGCKLSTALELERYPSWRPRLMGCCVNPTFHSQMSKPDQPLHQIT